MKSNKIRTFFAIPVSLDCRQEIDRIVLELKKDLPSVIKWVNINNLHVTLKFIGEFDSNDVPIIEKILRPVLFLTEQFELTFQSLGVFPGERNPKVVWVGINYPDELMKIFQEIESAALKLGYPKEERGFSPHVTIGRVKNNANDLLKIATTIKNKKVGVICLSKVNEVILYQSNLAPTGPVYSELFCLPLKR